MKGFIRILELIVASVIILSSLTFFLSPSIKRLGWDETNIEIEVRDSLESLYKNGSLVIYVNENDAKGMVNGLSSEIKKNIDFSISVLGIPNNEIFVSCLCTNSEEQELEEILSPKEFNYHDRKIRIGLEKADITQEKILMRPQTHVLFFFGYKDMNPYKSQLDEFLSKGGSIFILTDLSSSQIDDGYIGEMFGLKWSSEAEDPGSGEFYGNASPYNTSFRISKYYANFSNTKEIFTSFNSGSGVNRIEVDDRTIISDTGKKFSFIKTNSVPVRGRVVWSADYTRPDGNISLLIKSALMWSSGESYRLDSVPKIMPIVNSVSKIIIYDKDTFELAVSYWNIF